MSIHPKIYAGLNLLKIFFSMLIWDKCRKNVDGRHFRPWARICRGGRKSDYFFRSGAVEVYIELQQGQQVLLTTLRAGDALDKIFSSMGSIGLPL